MAVEQSKPIGAGTAVSVYARTSGQSEQPRPWPAAGETMQLRYAEAVGEALRADTAQGLSLWLSGAGAWSRSLSPGDVLLVRILKAEPRMEVELLSQAPSGGAPAKPPAGEQEPAAMRWDQAGMQSLALHKPDTAMLAATWQALLRRHGQSLQVPRSNESTASTGAGGLVPIATAAQPEALELMGSALVKPWLFPVYAWGGLPLMVRVFEAHGQDALRWVRSPGRRRLGLVVLRLELSLAGLGHVLMQVHAPAPGAIAFLLHVDSEAALPLLRQALSPLVVALARAGLRLVRCRLSAGPVGAAYGWAVRPPPWGDAMALTSDVFRAASEAVTLLVLHWPQEDAAR
ncbi:hypothetical protein AAFF27_20955 [Xylophilus sp. GW821-FHT01B05]